MQALKLPQAKQWIWVIAPLLVVAAAIWYFFIMPVAEVAVVRRGTALAAVYGTVRIESTDVVPVRAQNAGFIHLSDSVAAGRGAIGKSVEKGDLLATIADESTARQLKQAQADLRAAEERAALPLPSTELLKTAEDNVQRLEKLAALSNVPAVEYEKAKNEANRLRAAVENERIERDRNLESLKETCRKLEAQMKNTEIRAPMDGLISNIQAIDGALVRENDQLFTISSRKTYVRGEVNEEDVGEVKLGMKAVLQLYAYRTQQFAAKVSSIQPAADPETQRYTITLEMEKPPDNLMAGMTGEMNVITGMHENALLVPTRALLVDQAWIVKRGVVRRRTVNVGFRTLDFAEVMNGISLGDHVVVSNQDKLRPGQVVRERKMDIVGPPALPK